MTELPINSDNNTALDSLFSSNPLSWYAVHGRSKFEKRVADGLTIKGLRSYLPAVTEVHDWNTVRLFSGYVFTRFCDSAANRLAVLRTVWAARRLGFQDSIEPIPDAESESVGWLLQANGPLPVHPLLREGSFVRILRGPLKDLQGLVIWIKKRTRFVLSVELLSRSVSMEVNARDVGVMRAAPLSVQRPRPAEYSVQIQ